jgi:hypothetical protein
VEELPAEAGAEVVEVGDVVWWWSFGGGVVEVAVAVVGGALEAAVALVGGAAVGPGGDVVDVAALGGGVAAGGVLAVAVADFDGAA